MKPSRPGPPSPFGRWFSARAILAFGVIGMMAVTAIKNPPDLIKRTNSPAHEVTRGPIGSRRIALTFDAGGEIDGLPKLLDSLAAARIHCTFFLTGHWITLHPELAREIHAMGHEIGNHSWSHRDLTRLSDDDVRSEILRNDALLVSLLGRSPRPLFRAPYGARDARILRIAAEAGYVSIYWTLDSLDSVNPKKSPEYIIDRVTGRPDSALEGAIILMHVGESATAAAVPPILANFQQRGFKVETVSELLKER